MRHHLLSSSIATMSPPSSSSSSSTSLSVSKPLKPKPTHNSSSISTAAATPAFQLNSQNYSSSTPCCKHSSPSATTLDLLILILVLFSGTFLLSSYFSYIIQSLSLLLPSISWSSLAAHLRHSINPNYLYYVVFTISFITILTFFEICCLPRSRKCGKPKCKGLKKCMEFDLQLQTDECLKSSSGNGGARSSSPQKSDRSVKEIDELPWKGGSESNPDYECLRAELRKMAPPNGRAVLLFRAKCGCPVAKLEGWGPKRGRRQKNLWLQFIRDKEKLKWGNPKIVRKRLRPLTEVGHR